VVREFAKSLKPPIRLSLPALETLAVIAYKQPVTVPEISEIRGVDSSGVIATLLDRKLITTAGRKAVIGRPILYKSTKEFLLRFGLKDVGELPSMEEFEKLVAESFHNELLPLPENSAEVASAGASDPRVESEPTPSATDQEAVSTDTHVAGENDPAAKTRAGRFSTPGLSSDVCLKTFQCPPNVCKKLSPLLESLLVARRSSSLPAAWYP
jgi:segregation and condensation protein B